MATKWDSFRERCELGFMFKKNKMITVRSKIQQQKRPSIFDLKLRLSRQFHTQRVRSETRAHSVCYSANGFLVSPISFQFLPSILEK